MTTIVFWFVLSIVALSVLCGLAIFAVALRLIYKNW